MQYYPDIKTKLETTGIESVDTSTTNMIQIHFIDGTSMQLFAECGSGAVDIPYFHAEVQGE